MCSCWRQCCWQDPPHLRQSLQSKGTDCNVFLTLFKETAAEDIHTYSYYCYYSLFSCPFLSQFLWFYNTNLSFVFYATQIKVLRGPNVAYGWTYSRTNGLQWLLRSPQRHYHLSARVLLYSTNKLEPRKSFEKYFSLIYAHIFGLYIWCQDFLARSLPHLWITLYVLWNRALLLLGTDFFLQYIGYYNRYFRATFAFFIWVE